MRDLSSGSLLINLWLLSLLCMSFLLPWHLEHPSITLGSQSEAGKTKGVQPEEERADLDAMLTGGKSTSMLLCIALLSSFFSFAVLIK